MKKLCLILCLVPILLSGQLTQKKVSMSKLVHLKDHSYKLISPQSEAINDEFKVSFAAGKTIFHDGLTEMRIPTQSNYYEVFGGGGDDNLSVNFKGVEGMKLFYNGENNLIGTQGDILTIDKIALDHVEHVFFNPNDGKIIMGSNEIEYVGLEPVIDNLDAANREFTFVGGAETITLVDDIVPGDNFSMIDSDLGEVVTFLNPIASLTINAGTGNDVVDLMAIDFALPLISNFIANGDDDNDIINLNLDGFLGGYPFTIDGGSGIDNLVILSFPATLVTHNITGASSGTIDIDGRIINLSTIESLWDQSGGSANKIFNFSGASEIITLDDDAGMVINNSNISSSASPSIDFANPTTLLTINAGGGDDQIILNTMGIALPANGVAVNGDGGDDVLIVDLLGFPANFNIVYDGGSNIGPGDQLTINGAFNLVEHTFMNANDGMVDADSRVITYAGLEPIADNVNAVDRIFNFNGGSETIDIGDGATSPDATMEVNSTSGEVTTFTIPTNSIAFNAGSGDDIVNVASNDLVPVSTINIDGGIGINTLVVDAMGNVASDDGSVISINGLYDINYTNFDSVMLVNFVPIPTMSQWGIIILGLLLTIIGVVTFSVRRVRLTK